MGGADKGLLGLYGRPLVEWVLHGLSAQVDHVLINANRNSGDYALYGVPVVGDLWSDFRGPLAGIATAMCAASTDYLLTVPCDTPFVPGDLARRLRRRLDNTGAEVCAVFTAGRLQPLCALWRTSLAAVLVDNIEGGSRKVSDWLARRAVATVALAPASRGMVNINTPVDLQRCGNGFPVVAH